MWQTCHLRLGEIQDKGIYYLPSNRYEPKTKWQHSIAWFHECSSIGEQEVATLANTHQTEPL